MSCYYTISDMFSLKIGENHLSESVLECIENLNNSIVDTTTKPSKYDRRKNNDYRVKHQHQFKSTVIKKTETDLDVHINNIRISMNKVSANNMAQHRDAIMKSLEDLKSMNQEMKPIYFNILNTASSNRFGYKSYIEIIKGIIEVNGDFDIVLQQWLIDYENTIKEIKYVSGDSDYDAFCNYNKVNDKSKSKTGFIIELFIEKLLDEDFMHSMIDNMIEILNEWSIQKDKTNEIEEIVELLYIIASKHKALGEYFVSKIHSFIRSKKEDPDKYGHISSRSIFRSMDIVDLMK